MLASEKDIVEKLAVDDVIDSFAHYRNCCCRTMDRSKLPELFVQFMLLLISFTVSVIMVSFIRGHSTDLHSGAGFICNFYSNRDNHQILISVTCGALFIYFSPYMCLVTH